MANGEGSGRSKQNAWTSRKMRETLNLPQDAGDFATLKKGFARRKHRPSYYLNYWDFERKWRIFASVTKISHTKLSPDKASEQTTDEKSLRRHRRRLLASRSKNLSKGDVLSKVDRFEYGEGKWRRTRSEFRKYSMIWLTKKSLSLQLQG